jgi:hypothetical protein
VSRFATTIRVPDLQLVLQFRSASIEDLDELLEVEDALLTMLEGRDELAGHDIGGSARNIFIATDDADATFGRLKPFLAHAHLLVSLIAAERRVDDERYRILWPRDQRDDFSLV